MIEKKISTWFSQEACTGVWIMMAFGWAARSRLLEQATAGQQPDSGVTVAELLARYMEVAGLDVSAKETYEG